MLISILIVFLTIFFLFFLSCFKKDNFFYFKITLFSFFVSLFLLFLKKIKVPINIFNLLQVDYLSIFYSKVIFIFCIISTLIFHILCKKYEIDFSQFYILILISTISGILLSMVSHFFIAFLGIELISLVIFGMINFIFLDKKSLKSSTKYILLSSISSAFFLFGLSCLYSKIGSLSFNVINSVLSRVLYDPLFLIGFCMILVSLFFELSLFPFHLWISDIYYNTYIFAITFISILKKVSSFIMFLRLFLYVYFTKSLIIQSLLKLFSIISLLYSSLMMFNQDNIKYILAYSSIFNFSCMLLELIYVYRNIFSLEVINIYLIYYIFSTLGILFYISYFIENKNNIIFYKNFSFYYRFYKSNKLIFIILFFSVLSFIGFPITIGFIAKLYLLFLLLNKKLFICSFIVIFCSILNIFPYFKMIKNINFKKNLYLKKYIFYKFSIIEYICIYVLLFFILFFGSFPNFLIRIISSILPFYFIL